MAINPALYSSRRLDWGTPQWLFDALNEEFNFTLDAAASPENAKCPIFLTEEDDALEYPWSEHRVFLNPPYGRDIGRWMAHSAEMAVGYNTLVVVLIHARTDTKWWHSCVMPFASELRFVPGRVRFEGAPSSSPFPSVVVVFRPGGRPSGEPLIAKEGPRNSRMRRMSPPTVVPE